MSDPTALARQRVATWDRDRLHATDADYQVVRSFGVTLQQAAAIVTGERGRRP